MNDEPWKIKMEFGATVMDDRYLNPRPPPPDPEHPAHLARTCWCGAFADDGKHDYSRGICVVAAEALRERKLAPESSTWKHLLEGMLQAYDHLSKRYGAVASRVMELERTGLCNDSWCCEMGGKNVNFHCTLRSGHDGRHESCFPGQPDSRVSWKSPVPVGLPDPPEGLRGTCSDYLCNTCRDTKEIVRPAQVVAQSKLTATMPCPDCVDRCPKCSGRGDKRHPCTRCGRGYGGI